MDIQTTQREPIKAVRDILMNQLNIPPTRIWVADDKYDIPETDDMKIVLTAIPGKILANESFVKDLGNGPQEVQQLATCEMVQIDIMSVTNEARVRKEEVIMALAGIYAQQICEQYCLKIAHIPSGFVDVSANENTAQLKRYAITIVINALYTKILEVTTIDPNSANIQIGTENIPKSEWPIIPVEV